MKAALSRLIQSHWQKPRLWLSLLLYPLSYCFLTITTLRRRLYRSGCLKSEHLNVPVIVIGNLHIGGAGKTPLTAAIATALHERGLKVGIISRGYGRKNTRTLLVNASGSPDDFGDEPLLLAGKTGLPVAVGSDRIAAAHLLLATHPETQLILSDDGLQHYRLARDKEIVVFPAADAARRHLHVLPDGALREPLSRLYRTDALVLSNDHNDTNIAFRLPENLPVYRSTLVYGDFYALNHPEKTITPDFFAHKKTVALAAIAHPHRFFAALRGMKIDLKTTITLPDHACLTPQDIPADAEAVIITEKDAVKLAQFTLPQVWVLPVCAIIPDDLTDLIASCHVH